MNHNTLFYRISIALFVTTLSACGSGAGDSSPNNSNGKFTTAARTSVLAANDIDCPSGGILVESGVDENGNGSLEALEVDLAEKVCNGSDGASGQAGIDGNNGENGTDGINGENGQDGANYLVKQTSEAAGINCASGGVRFDVGMDADYSGILEVAEFSSTEYVCSLSTGTVGANGLTALIKQTTEISGSNCTNGGLRIDAGVDGDGNGLLDAGEISSTNFACNGAAGTNGANGTNGTNGLITLVKQTTEISGSNCTSGGLRIDVGVDSDASGVLDTGEITSTNYVCHINDALASVARLTDIQINTSTLDQIFQTNLKSYTATVTYPSSSIKIIATLQDTNGTLSINGSSYASGSESNLIELAEGSNNISIIATAEDGVTLGTYTLSITRQSLSNFAQTAYIKASNTGASDWFGSSLAVSDNTLVVGAPYEDSNGSGVNSDTQADDSAADSGAVYVFTRNGDTWAQEAYIKASNAAAGDRFGSSVAISGNTIAVGAIFEDSNGTGVNSGAQANNGIVSSGAVYIFTRSGTTWTQQAYIKASNTGGSDIFGSNVSLSGNTLAVSAQGEDSSGIGVNSNTQTDNTFSGAGAVYVFTRSGTTWIQEAYIKASNTDVNDKFGASIALFDNTLAINAEYEDSNGTGINSTTQADNTATNSGAVYVFTRSGTIWSQQAYIKASNAEADDRFGYNLALSIDTLAVGAYGEDSIGTGVNSGTQSDNSGFNSGAVYVFTRSSNQWSQEAYIKASASGGSSEIFGYDIALLDNILAVSAPGEDSNGTGINNGNEADNSMSNSGALYLFERSGTTWTQKAFIKTFNPDTSDSIGYALSNLHTIGLSPYGLAASSITEDSNDTGINASMGTDNSAADSGAVYIFR